MAELKAVTGRGLPDRVREADHPQSMLVRFGVDQPLKLDAGVALGPFQVAYQTYGTLNAARSNTVLVCHALTGDQHVFNRHPVTGKSGWWETMIGPGKPIDTERYFVVCSNMLGSSYGSTNAASLDPRTGRPYGSTFPTLTVVDIVTAQKRLLEHLGVTHLRAVVGPSYGGFQAFQWAVTFPDFMDGVAPVVTSPLPPQSDRVEGLLKWFEPDPNWNGGDYYDKGGVHGTLTALRVDTLTRRTEAYRRGLGGCVRRELAVYPRGRDGDLRCRQGLRTDQGAGAVCAVADGRAVPAQPGAGRDGRFAGGRGRCGLRGNRQRAWPSGIRCRCRQMGAGPARLYRQTGIDLNEPR
jgi:pimeloyl-ACP methyl ester carboxylesterase